MKKWFFILMFVMIPTMVFANTAPVPIDNVFTFNGVSFSKPDANMNVTVQGTMINGSPNAFNVVYVVFDFFDNNNNFLNQYRTQLNNVQSNASVPFKFSFAMPQGAVKYKISGNTTTGNSTQPKNDSTGYNNDNDPSQLLGLFMGYLPSETQNILGVFLNNLPKLPRF